jgi:hypothetical protein
LNGTRPGRLIEGVGDWQHQLLFGHLRAGIL